MHFFQKSKIKIFWNLLNFDKNILALSTNFQIYYFDWIFLIFEIFWFFTIFDNNVDRTVSFVLLTAGEQTLCSLCRDGDWER